MLESESNAMSVFRPWKSDSHFMESNLSSSNVVILASAGIVPQSTKTQNEQFPVSFLFCPTALASLSDVSQTEIRPKGQNCYRPPAALPVAASGNTRKSTEHKLFKDGKQQRMWWNVSHLTSELAFINSLIIVRILMAVTVCLIFVFPCLLLSRQIFAFWVKCLCIHMKSLLNYWLGENGEMGTFCASAEEGCFHHKLLQILSGLLSLRLSFSVSVSQ